MHCESDDSGVQNVTHNISLVWGEFCAREVKCDKQSTVCIPCYLFNNLQICVRLVDEAHHHGNNVHFRCHQGQ